MRAAVVFVTLPFVVALACSSESSSPTDAGPVDASIVETGRQVLDAGALDVFDAPSCALTKPYSTKDKPCNACAEAKCCKPINDCYASADCDDGYVNCMLACVLLPDDAGADAGDASADAGVAPCLADCAAQHPTGKSLYDAIDVCITDQCVSCQ